ncbi:MAG TPA: dockerin type I domain-containing protein, partial [Tepidisphaeraceae bacterium]|nr:dockerin type I domain-containing protein [Tepidisphaeraceae bacterium]
MLLSVTLPASVQTTGNVAYNVTGNAGAYDVDLTAGGFVLNADLSKAGSDWQNVTLQLGDGTNAVFNSPQTLGGLQLAGSTKLTASTGGGGANGNYIVIGPGGLLMAATATINLTDNDMILQGAGSAGVTLMQSLVASAFNGGNWLGAGIGSSNAAMSVGSAMQTAEGFALNGSLTTPFGTFDGVPVTSADVIDKYTVMADANLDGTVNLTDYRALTANYGKSGTTWSTADFNYDGRTNNADYALLESNYLQTIDGPNQARVLQPIGQTIAALANQVYSGPVGSFTDSNNPTADASTASYYTASIDWGNGTFVAATLAANGNGGFAVSGTSPNPLTDASALITEMVGYASGSPYAGQPGSLSAPITLVPGPITLAAASPAGAQSIALNWHVDVSNATGIVIARSTDGYTFSTIANLPAAATTYTDTSLAENTQYWYQITATLPAGAASPAASVNTTTLTALSNLVAAAPSSAQVNLTWSLNVTDATNLEVDRSTDGTNFTPITTNLNGSATSYIDTFVAQTGDIHYYYRVRAQRPGGPSSYSATADAWTRSAITDMYATAASTTSTNVNWYVNAPTAASIELDRSVDGVSYVALITTLSGIANSYTDTGLTEGTHYWYRACANIGGTYSDASAPFDIWTLPNAPSGLTAVAGLAPSNQVQLNWTNNSQGAADFVVQRSDDGGSTYHSVGNTGGTTSFVDLTVQPGQTYWYNVYAVAPDGHQNSAASSAVSVSTPVAGTSNASAVAVSPGGINLSWTVTASGATAVNVYKDDGYQYILVNPSPLAGTATSYAVTGLAPNSSYTYLVQAVTSGGGTWGVTASATTPPSAPTALQTTNVSRNEIDLLWISDSDTYGGYNVQRAPSGTGNFATIATTALPEYQDTSVSANTGYDYQIVAIGTWGTSLSSLPSAPITVTTPGISPAVLMAQGPSWYVDPTAPAGGDGKTPDTAFQTIQAAANVATAGSIVWIAPGTYREDVVPANSGDSSSPIIYRAFQGQVTISGTNSLTLAADGTNVYTAQIPTTFYDPNQPAHWSATTDLTVLGATATTSTNQVFQSSQQITSARYPQPASGVDSSGVPLAETPASLLTVPGTGITNNYVLDPDYNVTVAGQSIHGYLLQSTFDDANLWNVVPSGQRTLAALQSYLVGALIHIVTGPSTGASTGPTHWIAETARINAIAQDNGTPQLTYTVNPNSVFGHNGTDSSSGSLVTGTSLPSSSTAPPLYALNAGDYYYLTDFPTTSASPGMTPGYAVSLDSGSGAYVIDHYSKADASTVDPANLYLHLYSASAPSNVEVKTRDVAFDLSSKSYITLDAIDFTAATVATDDASTGDVVQNAQATGLSQIDRTSGTRDPNSTFRQFGFSIASSSGTPTIAQLAPTFASKGRPLTTNATLAANNAVLIQLPTPPNASLEWVIRDRAAQGEYLVVLRDQIINGQTYYTFEVSGGDLIGVTRRHTTADSVDGYARLTYTPASGWTQFVSGIELMGPADKLSASQVANTAASGVTIGGSGDIVTGSIIHDVNTFGNDAAAVTTLYNSQNASIDHNTMYNSGRSLVSHRNSPNVQILYNDLLMPFGSPVALLYAGHEYGVQARGGCTGPRRQRLGRGRIARSIKAE